MFAGTEKPLCRMDDTEHTRIITVNFSKRDWARLQILLKEVKKNTKNLQQEWAILHSLASSAVSSKVIATDDVIVLRSSLQAVATVTANIKTLLPQLLHQNQAAVSARLLCLDEELEKVRKENDALRTEVVHWKTQLDNTVTDAQKEKKEQLELRMEVQDLTDQLSQQSDFCSSLGAACCTLLWKVSRQEESIQHLVAGNKSVEFLDLVVSSIQSYLRAYKDDQWPEQDTEEATFILALCGTLTNIAASALGREYLASTPQGRAVVDTFVTFIGDAPLNKSSNVKSLMLMSLYNISINQKGVKYMCSKAGLVPMLCWHLKEEKDTDNRVNTMRFLQSLIIDEASSCLILELKENLPMPLLQQMTTSSNKNIQDLALDIIMDMRRLDMEQ